MFQKVPILTFQADSRVILKTPTEQQKFVEKDFIENYTEWLSPVYSEQDWSKAQELKIRELLNERAEMAEVCQSAKCLECPQFLKHVSTSSWKFYC